jgi:hypothetical protein
VDSAKAIRLPKFQLDNSIERTISKYDVGNRSGLQPKFYQVLKLDVGSGGVLQAKSSRAPTKRSMKTENYNEKYISFLNQRQEQLLMESERSEVLRGQKVGVLDKVNRNLSPNIDADTQKYMRQLAPVSFAENRIEIFNVGTCTGEQSRKQSERDLERQAVSDRNPGRLSAAGGSRSFRPGKAPGPKMPPHKEQDLESWDGDKFESYNDLENFIA